MPESFSNFADTRKFNDCMERININYIGVIELPPKNIMIMPQQGLYSSDAYSKAYGTMWVELNRLRLSYYGIEHLTIHYDIAPNPDQRYDICIHTPKLKANGCNIEVKELKGGKFAKFMYIGDYPQLELAYRKIYNELLSINNLTIRGRFHIDIHTSDPKTTPSSRYKTEIYIPIK